MGLLNIKSVIFTVFGTNGKGTTCAILEKLLLNSVYTFSLYYSPHFMTYIERVQINGNLIKAEEHIAAF